MQPTGISERKKKIAAFAGLYVASIILLLFIFSAFGWRRTTGIASNEKKHDEMLQFDKDLLHADSLLHSELFDLQIADRYYSLLPDSAGVLQRTNAITGTINSLNAINKSIDSISQMTSFYKGELGDRYKTLLSTFSTALSDRLLLKNAGTATNSKTASGNKTREVFDWENDILLKNDEIARLKQTINNLQSLNQQPTMQSGKTEAQKGETDLLKTAFNDLQKDFDVLKDKYNRLKTENSNALSELADARKTPAPMVEKTSNVNDSRVNKLQQQVEDLNAALYFAKIDCNLVRSDAHQIISNSRQRKELLLESLEMLNSLAKSGDATIQKKAKEKIDRLNQIANTLHD